MPTVKTEITELGPLIFLIILRLLKTLPALGDIVLTCFTYSQPSNSAIQGGSDMDESELEPLQLGKRMSNVDAS